MRTPPPFEVTLHDAPAWRVVQALLWALAGAGLGAWLASAMPGRDAGPEARSAATAAAAGLGALVAAALGWWRGRPCSARLRWSGRRWELWGPAGGWQPAALQAMLDLGGWMLLRVRSAGGASRWIGAAEPAGDEAGQPLRAALYCAPCPDPGRADEDRARS
ncbi:MAG: hypothetical protein ACKO6D_09905 [Rubrivivax sp.]